ncbi:G-type lectin S-receptor-like serine/threonine-protein kinase [Pyrus ussuriensis x Pyrus communis]|uniref:G-type lectin S-receptor-like serine/threonine-protein kinase n=1 Tax=Pyrus ussuriensis x Pyrus communis TaxID=2448454 RepID=A0A5N5I9L5_9ROSA|nr:G-type lectin S-receptor-like serine/threonine-protein kinase [Pyrus ussuriensis x Pyrus communis]
MIVMLDKVSYINQITVPQQAPASSILDIQICISRVGAVLHAHHLTFLGVHTSVKPGLFYARKFHPRVLLEHISSAI